MWFGTVTADNAWAMVSGYLAAERDNHVSSHVAGRMDDFQRWLDERYPFARGVPWFRLFRLLVGPETEFDRFREHLDLFLSGAPPDVADPGMQRMLEAIARHAKRGDAS